MATGRSRRPARRGIAVALPAWSGVTASSVTLAPGAAAASTATVEIRNLTPPVAGARLEEGSAGTAIGSEARPATLLAAALAAVVALAAVTAALIRTHQAARETR